jgi:aldose 1-epimerase (EC 5.1.3.3)
MELLENTFGEVEGKTVHTYTLINGNGMRLTCLDFGCIVTEISVPDREGRLENVVLSYPRIEDYIQRKSYFGAIIGRVAGRIGGSRFELDGKTYRLPANEGKNHLHGGMKGFHERFWKAKPFQTGKGAGVEFTYFSPDGEEGYPGNLQVKVRYTLDDENRWTVEYEGVSDRTTLLNMTNHSYFNLSGDAKRDILGHRLTIKSDRYLKLAEDLLPTGELADVTGTVFDFRQGRLLNDGAKSRDPQNILAGGGYDHPFVLTEHFNHEIILEEDVSGRSLTVETDRPAVIVYTANGMDGSARLASGVPAKKHIGVCLETQSHPDATNHPHFPSIVLKGGETYRAKTIYRFDIK